MSEWSLRKLGDLIDIKHGWAFKGEYFSDKPTDYILLTPGNFYIGGGFKGDKLKYYTGEVPEEYILKQDELLITMTDLSKEGDTLGYPAKIPKSKKTFLHNQRLGLVKLISNDANLDFLYWLMRTRNYQRTIVNNASGSTVRHTSPSKIKEYEFKLPPLNEQKEISKTLNVLENKIDLLRRQNETLEAIVQTLFKRWFVEFEFPDENGLPYKSSGGKMVSSELGEIPEGWRVGKINEISTISTGKGLKRAEYIEKGSYSVYGTNGEMGRTNSFLFDEKLIITGRVGTLGNIYIVNGKMWISDNVLILKPEENFFYFTYFAMKRINFQSLNRGSTQPLITQTDLKNFEKIIPEKQIVDQFDLFSLGLFSKIENNMGQIDHLTKIRDILLPKLMSGQIRVK